ncbi:unnamed protein product, partial [Coccothraustes coccothraustes]
ISSARGAPSVILQMPRGGRPNHLVALAWTSLQKCPCSFRRMVTCYRGTVHKADEEGPRPMEPTDFLPAVSAFALKVNTSVPCRAAAPEEGALACKSSAYRNETSAGPLSPDTGERRGVERGMAHRAMSLRADTRESSTAPMSI